MKHTECKNCELSNGDCGYHFKMDGKTNYDIASLSACDKYGNCEFFKSKAKPIGERSRGEWGKWVISEIRCPNCLEYFQTDCYSTEELKKCPNCGTDMRGAE